MNLYFTTIMMILILSSCVSVEIGGKKTKPAKGVEYSEPKNPFKEIKAVNSDRTWLSEVTGNTISYLSECGNASDPSLSSIESESLSVLSKIQVIKAEVTQFNGREAHASISTGEVDGVPVQISLMVFKKNGCNYTLSYSGVQRTFQTEEIHFKEFLTSFKAP